MTIAYGDVPQVAGSSDPADHERLIAFAGEQFDKPYYSSRGDAVRALGLSGADPARRDRVVSLLREGLVRALRRGEPKASGAPGLDANPIGVAAAAVALARLGAKEAEPELRAAFTSLVPRKVHFELAQAAGPVAVALATLGAEVAAEVRARCELCVGIWGAAKTFVNQLQYAQWVTARDEAGALAWVESRPEGRAFALAALVDLRAVHLASAVRALLETAQDPPSRRALTYALRRLDGSAASGPPMIFDLPLWHENEPAREFRTLYASLLDDRGLD